MRRLLYSFVFTFVLLLASLTTFAGFDEPGGGGTVPDGEYQVWLPVVEMAIEGRYPNCPFLEIPVYPINGEVVSGTVSLRLTRTPSETHWPIDIGGSQYQIATDSNMESIIHEDIANRVHWAIIDTADYELGGYYWHTRVVCFLQLSDHYETYYGPWSPVESFEIVR